MPVVKIKSRSITDKERLFVSEYWKDEVLNVSAAARRSGHMGKNAASQLLSRRRVRNAINEELKLRLDRNQLTQDDILKHICVAAYLDPLEVFEWNGDGVYRVKDLAKIPKEIRQCITKLKSKVIHHPNGRIETETTVEFISKDKMIHLAMQHLGLLNQEGVGARTNIGVNISLADMLIEVGKADNVIDAISLPIEEQKKIDDAETSH